MNNEIKGKIYDDTILDIGLEISGISNDVWCFVWRAIWLPTREIIACEIEAGIIQSINEQI